MPAAAQLQRRPAVGGHVVFVAAGADVVAASLDGCGSGVPQCPALNVLDSGNAQITGGPVVSGGRVVAGTAVGEVVAFGLPG